MGCKHYFVVGGLKRLSMKMTLDLLHEFANTEIFGLFHNCMWQYPDTLKSMSISSSCVNEPMDCPLTVSRACLICVYVFVCVFVFLYTLDTDTQLFAGLSVLTLVLSQPKQDIFFDLLSKRTRWGRPVLT